MALQATRSRADFEGTVIEVTESHVNTALLVLGRLIFGGYFVYSGLNHFLEQPMLAAFAAGRGVPMPDLAVLGTGVLLVVGGVAILTGLVPRLGAAMIALFLVCVTPVMHAFWNDAAPEQRMADIGHFAKNLALFGAALVIAALPGRRTVAVHRRDGTALS